MLQNNVGQHISKNTYLIQSHHFLSLRDLPLYADINTEYASTIFSQYFQHQRKIYSAEKEKKNTVAKKQLATQYQDKVHQMKSKGTNYW
jgi:hypothetical protein